MSARIWPTWLPLASVRPAERAGRDCAGAPFLGRRRRHGSGRGSWRPAGRGWRRKRTARLAGPGRVLPLGLGRQPGAPARGAREPLADDTPLVDPGCFEFIHSRCVARGAVLTRRPRPLNDGALADGRRIEGRTRFDAGVCDLEPDAAREGFGQRVRGGVVTRSARATRARRARRPTVRSCMSSPSVSPSSHSTFLCGSCVG